jgi:glucokinase
VIGAVDIGGTKIAVGMVDDAGRVLSRIQTPTDPNDYAAGIEQITSLLGKVAKEAGAKISGIGIGSTGPVDPMRGEFADVDFLPGWRGKRIVNHLAEIFKVSVALENDGDAAALAEAGWGAGRNRSRLIYVTIGTGIGGGIILDGKLYRGVEGAHPEIGHQIVDPAGPECSCGFRGCWESLAAGPAMAARYKRRNPAQNPVISAKRICELARRGDRLALEAVEHEALYLGLGLANLISLFAPDAIVLSGSLMKSAPLFLDRMRAVIRSGCRFVPAEKTELNLASLGEDANLIGAARVWHCRFGNEQARAAQ